MMRFLITLWTHCCVYYVLASHVLARLDIIYNDDVASIHLRAAKLTCIAQSDKIVKEVVWYKLSTVEDKKIVYYFEPPKFNASGPLYKNRVHLDVDSSSLVFPSVALEDEGIYECRVTVATNVTSDTNEIPEERSAIVKLTVNVPPSDVEVTTFASGKNVTFTCSSRSKPEAAITWIITKYDVIKSFPSAKVVVTNGEVTSDAVGYFYVSLSHDDKETTIACVVDHPMTGTTLTKNETMVAPALLHPVNMHFDWLGGSVPYSEFESNTIDNTIPPPPGLVRMFVSPSPPIPPNATVVVSVTSEGSFPEPRYAWWAQDLDLGSGSVIRIKSLTKSQTLFCLVENQVGRVLMSMQLDIGTSGSSNQSPTPIEQSEVAEISGAMVAGIAFAALVLLLLLSFIIYYVMFRRPAAKPLSSDDVEGEDFHSYIDKSNPEYSSKTPSGQIKVAKKQDDHVNEKKTSPEKQLLLTNPYDSPPGSYKDSPVSPRKETIESDDDSSMATTSGYGDDIGEVNGFENRPRDDNDYPEDEERAITKHLNDFGENASFVGGYGSTFGLDDSNMPDVVEMESRDSPFNQSSPVHSDNESYDSGASGIEGRYTLPHRDSRSLEEFNPNQHVGAERKPQII